jgi:hypothetical protein
VIDVVRLEGRSAADVQGLLGLVRLRVRDAVAPVRDRPGAHRLALAVLADGDQRALLRALDVLQFQDRVGAPVLLLHRDDRADGRAGVGVRDLVVDAAEGLLRGGRCRLRRRTAAVVTAVDGHHGEGPADDEGRRGGHQVEAAAPLERALLRDLVDQAFHESRAGLGGQGLADRGCPGAGQVRERGQHRLHPGEAVELLSAPFAGGEVGLELGRLGVVEDAEGVGADGLVDVVVPGTAAWTLHGAGGTGSESPVDVAHAVTPRSSRASFIDRRA